MGPKRTPLSFLTAKNTLTYLHNERESGHLFFREVFQRRRRSNSLVDERRGTSRCPLERVSTAEHRTGPVAVLRGGAPPRALPLLHTRHRFTRSFLFTGDRQ